MRQPKISFLAHLQSILALPFVVLIIIPFILLNVTTYEVLFSWLLHYKTTAQLAGGLLLLSGLFLIFRTIQLFHQRGNGTLAPWQPPERLVIEGPYRYVRNPMVVAVNALLIAEALLIPSGYVLLWQCCFFCLNHFYFIYKEEPDLVVRFGADYLRYKKAVPRWWPRWSPWEEIK